ncbi:MAG: hypothetical protein K2K07_01235 [Lachnospiraceae bacterium]|nr:hypothetical protein [Lachnospiraceae bacterium]
MLLISFSYLIGSNLCITCVSIGIAYYSPSRDLIRLPLFEQFTDANEYYSTAFHESVHSTMKETRCNRAEDRKNKLVAFGSEEYSKEELVAEIGSASLMNILGIETNKSFRNSSAYIQGWLSKLRSDVNSTESYFSGCNLLRFPLPKVYRRYLFSFGS